MRYIKAKTKIVGVQSAIVDDDLYEILSDFNWNITHKKGSKNYYYQTRFCGKLIKMHTLVMFLKKNKNPKGKEQIDHKNHITYDNRIDNLRIVNNSINSHNRKKTFGSSFYKGVHRFGNKWRSTIKHNGKTHHVGYFLEERDAAKAYDAAARKFFGEYASTNF